LYYFFFSFELDIIKLVTKKAQAAMDINLSHLRQLEAEGIHIIREVAAEFRNPVMLYSVGKDSSVMLHLARKAFYPGRIPFPLLHVDTQWKFQEMYRFRDKIAKEYNLDLKVWVNPEGRDIVSPDTHGSEQHTAIMKIAALKQALDRFDYNAAIGGARRDEEKSRSKERVFSFRDRHHRWDPKNQRPELWNTYNCRIHDYESIRIFPLSNWTELDIWTYILKEKIEIPNLYFAAPRPVVERNGHLIMVDDNRLELKPGEQPTIRNVRFRTLGCYPLTGGFESTASCVEDIIQELLNSDKSERCSRVIDLDQSSMEDKKREGYF
jgi:sulfate adenylyltransferase subunit 2